MNALTKTIGLLVLLCMSNSLRAGIVAYTHDPAGRLTSVNYATNKTVAYTYTAAGDILQRQFSAGAGGDSDGDGMDDAWELQYFGNLLRDGNGDFDEDGLTDLAEFLSGSLPNDPASVLSITGVAVFVPSGVTLEWASLPGKRYQLQYADSLAPAQWTNIGGEITATGPTTSAQDNRTIQEQRFYRVRLVP